MTRKQKGHFTAKAQSAAKIRKEQQKQFNTKKKERLVSKSNNHLKQG